MGQLESAGYGIGMTGFQCIAIRREVQPGRRNRNQRGSGTSLGSLRAAGVYNCAVIEVRLGIRGETRAIRVASCGCRVHTLGGGFFLAFLLLAPVVAQETGERPDAPTPKTGQVAIPLPEKPTTTPPPAKSASERDTLRDLPELATAILKYAGAASCRKNGCTILVADFVMPDGNSSLYGMQLAEELTRELASRGKKIQVIDRSLLHELLKKDRVPAKSINEGLARWIGSELTATLVVLGTTKRSDDDAVQLSARLLDLADKNWSAYNAVVSLLAPQSMFDFSPVESLAPLPPITTAANGEKLYWPGVDDVTTPTCYYMPNPPFSEGARKSKVSGSLTVEAVINSEGRSENERIIRGLPDGLNETTIATMKAWKCNPAQRDGKPVPTVVRFDVNFRMY